ncbi:nitrous oxide reductase accessory protein NosL [Pseudobacillus badius]|uniref:nitrous oxide reductase accessory protein NosL n=1 Tax=Bacillus badius TaxID=1455 RepID=UPI0024A15C0C|nr:nitrous oxide reductase accessory protein NosL [Bacillus badius]GLY11186.1 hypothetical protein Bbad01_24020 [Bacillus badius]
MKRILIFLVFSVLALAGCGKEHVYEPVEINPDIDACDICNMSIAATQYATEVVLTDGTVETFDDIGCMIEYLNQEEEKNIGEAYVRDVQTGDWVKLNEALFLYNKSYWTPMSYGVVSFADEKSAQQFMAEEGKGKRMNLEDIRKHDWGAQQ